MDRVAPEKYIILDMPSIYFCFLGIIVGDDVRKLEYSQVKEFIELNNCKMLSTEYINSREKINIECWCGNNNWFIKFNDFYNGRRSCPKHGLEKQIKTLRKNIIRENGSLDYHYPELCLEWNYDKNADKKPEDFSYSSMARVWWKCLDCSNEWEATINQRTNSETGCPACQSSKGERKIKDIFLSIGMVQGIDFISQYKFNDCRNIHPLPFDFYLPHHNLCIEYHGIQHYKPKSFFGGETYFKEQKTRDGIKEKYCRENLINFCVISYREYGKIEEILEQTLSKLG